MTNLWLVSYVALWLIVVSMAIVLLSVLRNLGLLLDEKPMVPKYIIGSTVPVLKLNNVTGQITSIPQLGRDTISIAIVKPRCPACMDYLEDLSKEADLIHNQDTRPGIIISVGSLIETKDMITSRVLPKDIPVYVDSNRQIINKWRITQSPTVLTIDKDFKVINQEIGYTRTEKGGD